MYLSVKAVHINVLLCGQFNNDIGNAKMYDDPFTDAEVVELK
jgi:hypothetical protein